MCRNSTTGITAVKALQQGPFPNEIVALVVGHLWNSPRAVRACTLACHAWYAAGRPYIYSRIVLSNGDKFDSLVSFLRSPNVRFNVIKHWIRELHVRTPHPSNAGLWWSTGCPYWVLRLSAALPSLLPRLSVLRFEHQNFDSEWLSRFMVHLSKFISVRELVIANTRLELGMLQSLASVMPNVRTLRLVNATIIDSQQTFSPMAIQNKPQFTILYVESVRDNTSSENGFISWIRTWDTVQTLAMDENHRLMPALLGTFGPFINHFRLIVRDKAKWVDASNKISLWYTTTGLALSHVRTLEFFDVLDPTLVLWLRHLPSPGLLEKIVFRISFNRPRELKSEAYETLDECLANSNLSGLREIRFLYEGTLAVDLVSKEIQRVFPKAHCRGFLQIFMADPEEKLL
ncbi:unnamed protein product [Somion occarium]|uniref:F-box domain-containing protein n=1 Tax=Somion occarium TaxID=3059160 RepID=A0ABP1CU03_9APHY